MPAGARYRRMGPGGKCFGDTIQEAAGAAIAVQYGIEGASITKWSWGWPGESFTVATPGGRRYFGKLFYARRLARPTKA